MTRRNLVSNKGSGSLAELGSVGQEREAFQRSSPKIWSRRESAVASSNLRNTQRQKSIWARGSIPRFLWRASCMCGACPGVSQGGSHSKHSQNLWVSETSLNLLWAVNPTVQNKVTQVLLIYFSSSLNAPYGVLSQLKSNPKRTFQLNSISVRFKDYRIRSLISVHSFLCSCKP